MTLSSSWRSWGAVPLSRCELLCCLLKGRILDAVLGFQHCASASTIPLLNCDLTHPYCCVLRALTHTHCNELRGAYCLLRAALSFGYAQNELRELRQGLVKVLAEEQQEEEEEQEGGQGAGQEGGTAEQAGEGGRAAAGSRQAPGAPGELAQHMKQRGGFDIECA
eukprot:scaffold18259_cov18-Tisochrysis_lutea.AAC.1